MKIILVISFIKMDNPLRLADFYCGVGGISRGFEKTGKVETVFAIDMDSNCKKTFDLNHDIEMTLKDINELGPEDIPEFDILTAGFNCQPFSISGKRKGFDDERTDSLSNVYRIIEHHKPRLVFFENVKNLKTHDNGKSLKRVITPLEDMGYYVQYFILNTCVHTSIPQNRERLFIIATLEEIPEIDIKKSDKSKIEPVKAFLEKEVEEKYYLKRSKVYHKIESGINNPDSIYQYRRGVMRENKTGVCPCLTAVGGCGGLNNPIVVDKKGIRELTPRECFNLQGFDKNFKLPDISKSHLYKQAGNSVSVPLITKIAKEIFRVMEN